MEAKLFRNIYKSKRRSENGSTTSSGRNLIEIWYRNKPDANVIGILE